MKRPARSRICLRRRTTLGRTANLSRILAHSPCGALVSAARRGRAATECGRRIGRGLRNLAVLKTSTVTAADTELNTIGCLVKHWD
jgi:hypothetical protein